MISKISKYIVLTIVLTTTNCSSEETFKEDFYACTTTNDINSNLHPKAALFQSILDQNQKLNVVGAVLWVEDQDGVWLGASGYADIASDIKMKPCNTFMIASISKVFTAVAVYKYIDRGWLSFNDTISQYLPPDIVEEVANIEGTKISDLLGHKSGIPDFYTTPFDLDRINDSQHWDKYDVLEYVYGLDGEFPSGTSYSYSNTNYLLLSIILERITQKSLEQIYNEDIFLPLNLQSAYYSESKPLPDGVVKGYADIYGNGHFVYSDFLYREELGIGGDGGIASNAQDLALFLKTLATDNFISDTSFANMTDWFDLPLSQQDLDDPVVIKNGYGLERVESLYGFGFGHTGGIDGFNTFAFYYPETDVTYVLLLNSVTAAGTNAPANIQTEILDAIHN
ncbi:serine hydrolase domain-containing protein [Winogradskyella sp.]|uniref:serine hydrolase domain-containing protein n=1 Tax=Winogradskyella sp. TaxID=1883156 RepID=UPI003BAC001D